MKLNVAERESRIERDTGDPGDEVAIVPGGTENRYHVDSECARIQSKRTITQTREQAQTRLRPPCMLCVLAYDPNATEAPGPEGVSVADTDSDVDAAGADSGAGEDTSLGSWAEVNRQLRTGELTIGEGAGAGAGTGTGTGEENR